ncbi:tectonin domain-containing protein [Candidatus Dependentiae bacterium]
MKAKIGLLLTYFSVASFIFYGVPLGTDTGTNATSRRGPFYGGERKEPLAIDSMSDPDFEITTGDRRWLGLKFRNVVAEDNIQLGEWAEWSGIATRMIKRDVYPRSFSEDTNFSSTNDLFALGFRKIKSDRKIESVSLADGGELNTSGSEINRADLLKIVMTATTENNEIYKWSGGKWFEPPVSKQEDHRAGNVVKIDERWRFETKPDESEGDDTNVNWADVWVHYRYAQDFRKHSDISKAGDIWIMGAGRSLYWGADYIPYDNTTAAGVVGSRLLDGTLWYLRDVAVGTEKMAMIAINKNPDGTDIGTGVYWQNGVDHESRELVPGTLPATPFSISMGSDDSLWMITDEYRLYRHTGTDWVEVETPEPIYRVSVGKNEDGKIAALSPSNRLYIMTDFAETKWSDAGILVRDVSVGEDGTIAVVSGSKQIYMLGTTRTMDLVEETEKVISAKINIGDVAGSLLWVDPQGLLHMGDLSAADSRTQFEVEPMTGGKFLIKTSDGKYVESRPKGTYEGVESAKESTSLRAISTTPNDNTTFVTEQTPQGTVIKSFSTGGYINLGKDGLLRSVNPDKNFTPYDETKTVLQITPIQADSVIEFLVKARTIDSTSDARIQEYLDLVDGAKGPRLIELVDKVTLVREMKFLVDDKAERGEGWSVSSSQFFNVLLDKVDTKFGTSPAVAVVIGSLKKSLSGVSLIAPTNFKGSFEALQSQFSILEKENIEQFMADLRALTSNRVDGEKVPGQDGTPGSILQEFRQWLEFVVARNSDVMEQGGVRRLLEDLEKPISTVERVERIDRLAQVQTTGLNQAEIARQISVLLPNNFPDSRLSTTDLRKLKTSLMTLKIQSKVVGLSNLIKVLETPELTPTFESFIEARRTEINNYHSDNEGLWDSSKDHLDNAGMNNGYLYAYPLRSFWGVLKRFEEWRPDKDKKEHTVPLKVLLKQVQASVEAGFAGENVTDIGREAATMLDKLGG